MHDVDGSALNAVPIVLVSGDSVLGEAIRLQTQFRRLYACETMHGLECCYEQIAKIVTDYKRDLLGDMQSLGWATTLRNGRHRRVGVLAVPRRFGEPERATTLYDLGADRWNSWSGVRRRMFETIADDDETDVVAEDLNHLDDLVANPESLEADFQEYFEDRPHALRTARHELVPHPRLVRSTGENLYPDFVTRSFEGFHDTAPRLIEIKRPQMRLLTGRNEHRTRYSSEAYAAITQVRDYGRWIDAAQHARARKRVFASGASVRLELIAGRSKGVDGNLLDRERRLAPDVSLMTYDEIRATMHARHAESAWAVR